MFEVGAGDGRFLAAARRAGYSPSGLDPSRVPRVADASGIPIAHIGLEEFEPNYPSYDAVCFFHVLEHLENPGDALRRAGALLRPGGMVVVAVPNLASVQASLGGDAWFGQDAPRHLTLFTPEGLERLLDRCGYALERKTTLVVDQTLLGMFQTLLNRVTRTRNVLMRILKRRETPRRDVAIMLAAAIPAAAVAVPLEAAAAAVGRGGSLVVTARLRRSA